MDIDKVLGDLFFIFVDFMKTVNSFVSVFFFVLEKIIFNFSMVYAILEI